MNKKQSLFTKLWQSHLIQSFPDGTDLLHIDRVLLHERTGGVALQSLKEAGHKVKHPELAFATLDHIVDTTPNRSDQTRMPGGEAFIRVTRQATKDAGIKLFDLHDPQQGIVHVLSPELGIVLPGLTLVCPDSHTCTQGALGALAWGIGSSEAEHALATQTLRLRKPECMRVSFEGELAPGVTAKDMALALIARFGAAGAQTRAVEFAGSAVQSLSMEARMTLCNLAVEFSAFTAVIAPDETTFAYLQGRPHAPEGEAWERALEQWRELRSDQSAAFDAELHIDASTIQPMVTWGTSPEHACALSDAVPEPQTDSHRKALTYMGLQAGQALASLPIQAAFIGSCTNSRLSDLQAAAAVLQGRKVAAGVKAICVPGSTSVKRVAEALGLHKVFEAAGFEWRESGCSMCFFAGGEGFAPGERTISTTNRNFEGRQGLGVKTHLASPVTVAASAVLGRIGSSAQLDTPTVGPEAPQSMGFDTSARTEHGGKVSND